MSIVNFGGNVKWWYSPECFANFIALLKYQADLQEINLMCNRFTSEQTFVVLQALATFQFDSIAIINLGPNPASGMGGCDLSHTDSSTHLLALVAEAPNLETIDIRGQNKSLVNVSGRRKTETGTDTVIVRVEMSCQA